VPPPGAEEDYFPPAMRLPTARARQLALRYYVNRFPTLNTFQAERKTATGRTTSKSMRTALSANEEEAVQDLKPMDNSTCLKRELATVMTALETLSKFADKGMVKYELTRMVSAISNARRKLKPAWKTAEFARPSCPIAPKRKGEEVS
jgi:hypothetical protein